ncbi:MAG: hypothetical protein DRI90_14615 [Deltaproteobacteria bacterium]|nr:MAG: hypothetical protein DRI90_14615 [Deltaproteobacteria bacterium]
MAGGNVTQLDDPEGADANALATAATDGPSSPFTAICNGFNLHAGVLIDADDDEGRERLARYSSSAAATAPLQHHQ